MSELRLRRIGPRQGCPGQNGGRRPLVCHPDETVTATALGLCALPGRAGRSPPRVAGTIGQAQTSQWFGRWRPVCAVSWASQFCGGVSLAQSPERMEQGFPLSISTLTLAVYPYARNQPHTPGRAVAHIHSLQTSEGALDAMFQRAKLCLGNKFATILARPHCARVVCSDETSVRNGGKLTGTG